MTFERWMYLMGAVIIGVWAMCHGSMIGRGTAQPEPKTEKQETTS